MGMFDRVTTTDLRAVQRAVDQLADQVDKLMVQNKGLRARLVKAERALRETVANLIETAPQVSVVSESDELEDAGGDDAGDGGYSSDDVRAAMRRTFQ